MKMMASRTALAFATALVFAGSAQAQPRRNYNVPIMNYDMWCMETMNLPYERCSRRQPADVEAFEAFRTTIQSYEIPHLQQKNKDARIESDILRSDPIDRSQTGTLQAQQTGGLNPPLPGTVP